MSGQRAHASVLAVGLMALVVLSTLSIASVPARAMIEPEWVEEAPMPGARVYAITAVDDSGLVYVCGGAITTVHETPTDTAFTYDSATGSVAWLPPMPVGVRGGSGAVGADGKMYVFTGYNDTAASEMPDTQIYDPVTEAWSAGADVPIPMWGSKAQLGSDGRIYVMGGSDATNIPQNDVQIYDPETDSWSVGVAMPSALYHGVAIAWGEYIFYIGGLDDTFTCSDEVHYYSVLGDWWDTYSYPAPISRWGASGCLGEDGVLYYVGGNDDDTGTVVGDGACLNLRTGTWTDVPAMSVSRFYFTMVSVPDGRIMAFGGSDWSSMYSSVESMNVADESVELSSDTVVQGGSVTLSLEADFAFSEPTGGYIEYYVKGPDGTLYLYDEFSLPVWGPVAVAISLPDICPAGEYSVVLVTYYLYEGWSSWPIVEDMEMALTLVDGYTVEEQLAMLEANMTALSDALQTQIDLLQTQLNAQDVEIADLQAAVAALQGDLDALADQLSTLEGDVSSLTDDIAALQDELASLRDALNETAGDVGDVQTSVDDKLSATMGYAIIGLLVVVIILLIVMMVMGRKAPPPPAP